ncbi:MAG: hypothetical protein KF850_10080 [Labilithrix sp.]|nr:hypothetical protein [Labilithrix sp.]MBX3212369.1 hypothetical protein [Labilithrix sp.]
MSRASIILVAGLLAVAACENKQPADKPEEDTTSKHATTTGATQVVATTTPAAPAAPVIADSDLSTPADFEESAEKAISKATYKAELAALEADIAKD